MKGRLSLWIDLQEDCIGGSGGTARKAFHRDSRSLSRLPAVQVHSLVKSRFTTRFFRTDDPRGDSSCPSEGKGICTHRWRSPPLILDANDHVLSFPQLLTVSSHRVTDKTTDLFSIGRDGYRAEEPFKTAFIYLSQRCMTEERSIETVDVGLWRWRSRAGALQTIGHLDISRQK